MAAIPPICDFGWKAPTFTLKSTNGKLVSLDQVAGPKGVLVVFMCNHCPYVLAILDRLIADSRILIENGIGVVAINLNDAVTYPADSFDNMMKLAEDYSLPFAYLHDETQDIARAYDAVCTPDFFGFNANLELQYRGRLDASGKASADPDTPRELLQAMLEIAKTGHGPSEQIPSIGCSIKWKDAS